MKAKVKYELRRRFFNFLTFEWSESACVKTTRFWWLARLYYIASCMAARPFAGGFFEYKIRVIENM